MCRAFNRRAVKSKNRNDIRRNTSVLSSRPIRLEFRCKSGIADSRLVIRLVKGKN